MIPIPAIDLKDGRCVRLMKGDLQQETVYGQNPVAMARKWESAGARRLHVVDLDGAVQGYPVHRAVIQRIVEAVSVPVEVGGGIRTLEEMASYLNAGVHTVIVGTSAFLEAGLLEQAANRFPGRIAVALDTRNGRVVVRGWLESTGDDVTTWVDRFGQLPVFAVIHTDVGRDGTQEGPNLQALREVLETSARPVIASGGVGSLQDLKALKQVEAEAGKAFLGVIIGRALYERRFTLQEATNILGDPAC